MRVSKPAKLMGAAMLCVALLLHGASPAVAAAERAYPAVTLWPLVYHQQDQYRARTDVLYPIFHYKREGSHERFAIRPLLYNREKDPAKDFRQTNVIWPLSHFETDGERFLRYIFPVYYHERNAAEFALHLWPFYGYSLRLDGTETRSTLYPFFQYRTNAEQGLRQTDYFWPLGRVLQTPEMESNYLLPLWWFKTAPGVTGRYVFPYLSYTTEDAQHTALLPFWYRKRTAEDKLDLLLPVWYSRIRDDVRFRTLFPLYWNHEAGPEQQLSLLIPFYGRYRNPQNDYQVLFPFYFRHATSDPASVFRYYFPLYGDYRQGDEIRHAYYLFPVYAHIEDQSVGREAWYFLWPLIYRDVRAESHETWVAPLYWAQQTPERKFRVMLLPPYYQREQGERKDIHFWPFYGLTQDRDYRERSLAWPLFRWGASPSGDRRAWQFLLLYRGVEPDRQMLGFFPLWHQERTPERVRNVSLLHWQEQGGDAAQFSLLHLLNADWSMFTTKTTEQRYHQHLFPFYSYTRRDEAGRKDLYVFGPVYRYRDEGGESTSHRFLWKVLYCDRSPEQSESGFLWRLIRSRQDAEGSLLEVNPFYYRETRSNGDAYTAWLGGVYALRKGAAGTKHTLFWGLSW